MVLELLALVAFGLVLNKKTPGERLDVFGPQFTRIRCPLCQWRPRREDRWLCDPGCHHTWNTFETAGICPGCAKHWDQTACLKCSGWSPHADWYEHDE